MRRHVLRYLVGLAQMTGATAAVVLLLKDGLSVWAFLVTAITSAVMVLNVRRFSGTRDQFTRRIVASFQGPYDHQHHGH
jgi:hypothetical protein